MNKVRVAIVGAGELANMAHYPSLASFEDVTIDAICDIDSQRLNQTADKYNISKRFANYKKMVTETAPDALYVIGPAHYMYDIWIWSLEQKLNLFIEKPMGLTLHQAKSLAYLAEKNGCITQVGYQRRSCPLLKKMRDECLKHGSIHYSSCEFYKHALKPRTMASDHLTNDGSHAVDTVRWLCGGEVVKVESFCKRIQTPDVNCIGALLHFDNGSTGYVFNNFASGRRVFRLEMHAPNIYVDAEPENIASLYKNGDYEGEKYDSKKVAGSDELYVFGGFREKNCEFIDSIKNKEEKTSSPFSDAVKTMEIVEIIKAQSLLSSRNTKMKNITSECK